MKACLCLFLVHWLPLLNTATAFEPGAETTLRYTLIRANSPDCLPSPPAESYPVLVQYMSCSNVGDTTETETLWRELESIPGRFSEYQYPTNCNIKQIAMHDGALVIGSVSIGYSQHMSAHIATRF